MSRYAAEEGMVKASSALITKASFSSHHLGLARPMIRVHFAALWLQLILVLNSPVTWVSTDTSSIVVGRFSTETLLSFKNTTITALPEPSCDSDTPWPTTPGKFNR